MRRDIYLFFALVLLFALLLHLLTIYRLSMSSVTIIFQSESASAGISKLDVPQLVQGNGNHQAIIELSPRSFLSSNPTAASEEQNVLNYISSKLFVEINLDQRCLLLANFGNATITDRNWSIYFTVILKQRFTVSADGQLLIRNVKGRLFVIEPTSRFRALPPKHIVKIYIMQQKPCFYMPNWYVAYKTNRSDVEPRILHYTLPGKPFVVGRSIQWDWSPIIRHRMYAVTLHIPSSKIRYNVVPTPQEVYVNEDEMVEIIPEEWAISAPSELKNEAKYLADKTKITAVWWRALFKRRIYLILDGELSGKKEEYKLEDWPEYPHRAHMQDVSRNFVPLDELKLLIDVMAMYKMNVLHLHLTDDEAWRLEIPSLPELTTLGSRVCHDVTERKCLLSFLGQGPFTNNSGNGFYSVEEYKDLLSHAKSRHIEIIPEVDLPSHSRAAILAMEVRYRESNNDEFRLLDPADQSVYEAIDLLADNTINPCVKGAHNFVKTVMKTIVEMHKDIQPLRYFHFGGDEIPRGAVSQSPACRVLFRSRFYSRANVMSHFVKMVREIAGSLNVSIYGWEDGFEDYDQTDVEHEATSKRKKGEEYLPPLLDKWISKPKFNHLAEKLASLGHKVVMSTPKYLYLDHGHEPGSAERGLIWATKYISLLNIYFFEPWKSCPACKELNDNTIGIQSALWNELVPNRFQRDDKLYPRLLAVAERAWAKMPEMKSRSKTWSHFANSVGKKEIPRLCRLGIRPHVHLPAVRWRSDVLFNAFPGEKVEVSQDGGVTWRTEQTMDSYDGRKILLRSRSPCGQLSDVITFEQ